MSDVRPVVFIPALLCDEQLYRDVIDDLGEPVDGRVLMSPLPRLEDSVADILARAPDTFALVGTSYGSNLALEVALAAPERVTALCLMGCDPDAPQAGGPDLAGGLRKQPDATIDMLAGLVVHADATEARATFKAMATRVGAETGAVQASALAVRSEATSRLDRLTMPVLLLWGAEDALVPLAKGQALAERLPHATFEILPDCGHLPTLERPADAARLLRQLLEKTKPDA